MPGDPCSRCRTPSVLYQKYSGRHFCEKHLGEDILIRAKRTIRLQGGLGKKSVIVIYSSKSTFIPLLYILVDIIGSRPGVELVILKTWDINFSCRGGFSFIPSHIIIREKQVSPELVMSTVAQIGADRIMFPDTLEDEAEDVLNNLLSGSCSSLVIGHESESVTCLTPLCGIPVSELILFSHYIGLPVWDSGLSKPENSKLFLPALTKNHPSVPFSLLKYRDRLRELEERKI